ncbi:MAG: hypothetical protein REJ50_16725 [Bordetella sp.]|nr:hypothetical protein [Bordetella sp.]
MREVREYAVVMAPGHGDWVEQWLTAPSHQATARFFPVDPCAHGDGSPCWLAQATLMLRRFDACLLPVEPATLSWARTAMAGAREHLGTPVLALVRKVRAAGVLDLTELGVADYLIAPPGAEELRVRTEMALARQRVRPSLADVLPEIPAPAAAPAQVTNGLAWRYDVAQGVFQDPAEEAEAQSDAALAGPQAAAPVFAPPGVVFDIASVQLLREHLAVLREPAPRLIDPHAEADPDTDPDADSPVGAWDDTDQLIDSPFGQAKAEMVGRFERAYLHRCLLRHGGNVTQAARASAKHRRAFWALMRKHQIRAAPYRALEQGAMSPWLDADAIKAALR